MTSCPPLKRDFVAGGVWTVTYRPLAWILVVPATRVEGELPNGVFNGTSWIDRFTHFLEWAPDSGFAVCDRLGNGRLSKYCQASVSRAGGLCSSCSEPENGSFVNGDGSEFG